MTAQTPGQAAYEAWRANSDLNGYAGSLPWDEKSPDARADWEAAAQAAINWQRAEDANRLLRTKPQPAPGTHHHAFAAGPCECDETCNCNQPQPADRDLELPRRA